MITEIFTTLQANWVATLLGAIALGLTFYQIFQHKGPALSYQFTGLRLIGRTTDPLPSEVKIQFEGLDVDHLSRTEVIIWNRGPAAVRSADLSANDPLRVSFNNSARIMMAEVTKVTRDANGVDIEIADGREDLLLRFDFLDRNDGALLTIWHDGFDTTPRISGTIIGQKEGVHSKGRFLPLVIPERPQSSPSGRIETFALRTMKIFKFRRVPLYLMIGVGIALTGAELFKESLNRTVLFLMETPEEAKPFLGVGVGVLYILTGLWFLQLTRRKFPRSLIPSDTEAPAADALRENEAPRH